MKVVKHDHVVKLFEVLASKSKVRDKKLLVGVAWLACVTKITHCADFHCLGVDHWWRTV